MHPMTAKKIELKNLASKIRELRASYKDAQRSGDLSKVWNIGYELYRARDEFRHQHIAYSLVRGRTYEQIEKPGEYNQPNKNTIEKYQKELQDAVDAANAEWKACREMKEAAVA